MNTNNKYKNKKTTTPDGIVHDSKKEALRWIMLCMLEKNGHIQNLKRQVTFELIPSQYETVERYGKNGKKLKDKKILIERGVNYVADFVYYKDGKMIVEDAKGTRTKEYIIKRKMMYFLLGIKINEV